MQRAIIWLVRVLRASSAWPSVAYAPPTLCT